MKGDSCIVMHCNPIIGRLSELCLHMLTAQSTSIRVFQISNNQRIYGVKQLVMCLKLGILFTKL